MKNPRIIIVEDLPIVAFAFADFLKNNGYKDTLFFSSGEEALKSIKNNTPDLALLDIKLAGKITGIEVATELKAQNRPFIFISAFSDPENKRKAIELKPLKILQKPIDMRQLLTEINSVLSPSISN